MYKKWIAGISIVLMLALFLFTKKLQNHKFPVFNPVSPTEAEEIWNNKTRVERFEFRSLMCNGTQAAIDYIEKTFYIPLDMETEVWETLEFTSGNSEYKIVFWEDFTKYDKKQLIAEGSRIEFLVYTENEFAPYYIVFTGLPIIDISTAEGIENQKEISGNAVFYDTNFVSYGVQTSEYNGHVRGNTSTLYPKKGYKMNLTKTENDGSVVNNKLSLFGMRKDDDGILYALYNDETKLRATLSAELWNEMGAKMVDANATYNTNISYVELIVDEAYHGMYALMEPIDAKQLNLDAADYLYKREHLAELTKEGFEQVNAGEIEAMGFELKSGELTENAWLPMAEFAEVINSSDEEFVQNIGKVSDLDNMMRLWLYIQVITGVDQREKNVFYVARKEGDSYQFTFVPWDLDLTWGNTSSKIEPYYTEFDKTGIGDIIRWQPGTRLMELNVGGAAEKMQELYKELRKTILSDEALIERMDGLNHILRDSGAYAREVTRWPESANAPDYSQVSDYAKERLNYLDNLLEVMEADN